MNAVMRARALVLLLTAASLAACTSSSRTGPSTPSLWTSVVPLNVAPARCPKDLAARLHANDVTGTKGAIVPGTPDALVLCSPATRTVIARAAAVHALAAALNGLKRVPPGSVFPCPADFGPTYGLFFDYANGDVLLVTADASGCRFASNGQRSAWLTSALLHRIRATIRA